jgi:RNA polymerase sigma factor (sigma-70 family)
VESLTYVEAPSRPKDIAMDNDCSGHLLARWCGGDQQAAEELFHRYVKRLIALARGRLSTKLARCVDPEDVVQSAYRSFFADARNGHYQLERGGDLWRLLVSITLHKLHNQVERLNTLKRAAEREVSYGTEDSLLLLQGPRVTGEPSPLEAVALADELEQLMGGLDGVQRRILELRLQGHELEAIAAEAHCGERTVRRVLKEVKQRLERLRGEGPMP